MCSPVRAIYHLQHASVSKYSALTELKWEWEHLSLPRCGAVKSYVTAWIDRLFFNLSDNWSGKPLNAHLHPQDNWSRFNGVGK